MVKIRSYLKGFRHVEKLKKKRKCHNHKIHTKTYVKKSFIKTIQGEETSKAYSQKKKIPNPKKELKT